LRDVMKKSLFSCVFTGCTQAVPLRPRVESSPLAANSRIQYDPSQYRIPPMKRFLSLGAPALLAALVMLAFCAQAQPQKKTAKPAAAHSAKAASVRKSTTMATHSTHSTHSATVPAAHLTADDMKLVSLTDVDPTIIIDSPLARTDSVFHYQFFKENVAYVRAATARKIAAVEKDFLKRGYRLKIWAAYRPQPVQIKMYDLVGRNGNWVSDPYTPNSKKAHVRGVAIDCTLVDKHGKELEMPTGYCDFKNYKKMMFDYMDLPPQVIRNRALLREVMVDHGMSPYSKEWWHFQDNRIMSFPAITMREFPELHKQILVDELYNMNPAQKSE
jgi:D-alanyl-D-alanine dipeptidase